MNYEKIGEFIAVKRKEKSLTQAELAKKLGVTDKAVSKWERGLGCPDISILEILAKELDVSVLELLKGRKIENEVIKVTEADDYVKDTFKVSKNLFNKELKKKISTILMSISVFLIIIMCVFNINTYRTLTKKESLDFSDMYEEDEWEKPNTSLYDKREKLKEYANAIEKNKGSLTSEEQEILVSALNGLYKYYNEASIFNINKETKLSYNDIYVNLIHDFAKYSFPHFAEVMNIYQKYTGKKRPEELMENTMRRNESEEAFIRIYDDRFKNQLQFKLEDPDFESQFFVLNSIISTHIHYIDPILNLAEEIMEVAGIHE